MKKREQKKIHLGYILSVIEKTEKGFWNTRKLTCHMFGLPEDSRLEIGSPPYLRMVREYFIKKFPGLVDVVRKHDGEFRRTSDVDEFSDVVIPGVGQEYFGIAETEKKWSPGSAYEIPVEKGCLDADHDEIKREVEEVKQYRAWRAVIEGQKRRWRDDTVKAYYDDLTKAKADWETRLKTMIGRQKQRGEHLTIGQYSKQNIDDASEQKLTREALANFRIAIARDILSLSLIRKSLQELGETIKKVKNRSIKSVLENAETFLLKLFFSDNDIESVIDNFCTQKIPTRKRRIQGAIMKIKRYITQDENKRGLIPQIALARYYMNKAD